MTFRPYELNAAPLYWLAGVLLVVMLVISAFIVSTASKAARLEYRLDEQGLTIAWGRGLTVPYEEIRGVQRIEGRPRLTRIVGTALPGVNVGTFNLSGVGRVRLYAGRIGDHLVIVDTIRLGRLGLTPDDPERFVEELRRRLR